MFRERLEKIWERTDRTLDKAEAAVRVGKDDEGRIVFGAPDITPIAPLLNAASKNLEMLGRATGELEPQINSAISIQILYLGSSSDPKALPRVTYNAAVNQIEEPADDCVEIGIRQGLG